MWCGIELIITAGGENVPPVYIEDCIKSEVPFLSNVMLIGDKRKYVSDLSDNTKSKKLLAIRRIIMCCYTYSVLSILTLVKQQTDDLQPLVIKILQQFGSNCTTVSQVIESEDKAVFKAIKDGIDRYNTYHHA